MCPVSVQLVELVKQRLSDAAEEIVTLLERTIIAYEEETERQRTLLEQLLQPRVQLTRIKAPCQPPHIKKERDPEPPHIKEEWVPEPPHIKEVQDIITTQLWSNLKTEELLPAPTVDTNPSPPQTQPVVACVFEAWAPLLTPTQTEEEPLAPSQTEEEPLAPSQTEEQPLALSQTEEEPQALSETKEELLALSQTKEGSLPPSETEEEPLAPSETEEEPFAPSESEEEQLIPIHTEEKPLSHSQTEEEPLIQTREKPQTFLCSFCNNTFKCKSLLVQHMRLHTGERPFSCSICGKSLSRKEHLKRHIQNVHSSCKPPLVILSTLSESQRKVGSHFCVFCHKEFVSKYRLERHIIVHTGEKPFSCSHCGRRFTQKSSLKVHLWNFHNTVTLENENTAARAPPDSSTTPAVGSAAIQRSLLHKKHSAESNAKQRLRNHSKCPTCDKFIPTTLLSRHLKIHTGEKPFSCSICGKNFSRKDALCDHMIVHSEERPFICSICGMSKKRRADLRIHMFTHHSPFLAGGTNQEPVLTSQAPACTNQVPAGTSQAPACTSQVPAGTNQAPAGTSQAPAGTSQMPAGTSQTPAGTSQMPAGTSRAPAGTGRVPAGTSQVANGAPAMASSARSKKACPICGKFVVTLRKHLITHSGERPFACTICGKKFSLKHHLQRHKIRHTKTSYFSSDSQKKQNAKGFAPSLIYCRIDD